LLSPALPQSCAQLSVFLKSEHSLNSTMILGLHLVNSNQLSNAPMGDVALIG